MRLWLALALALAVQSTALFGAVPSAAWADETVSIGGSQAVLLKPAAPHGSVILMPGGNGRLDVGPNGSIGSLKNNQLVRTRNAYKNHGLAVLVVDANVDLAAAVTYMRAIKSPVTVVATSRGTLRAASGIAHGAHPDALVLTSGFLSSESGPDRNVMSILGSPAGLPRTLIIHHRQDGCRFTQPAGVEPFIKWAGGKARVVWLDGGEAVGNPCQAKSHHGFLGLDGRVVSLAAGFR
ncbi:MAG: alpha/beta hydrolase [Proteobacteria bacterium]|nr:alpha/beta hydrolase [Pseudomonadota bacterium]